MCIGDTLAFRTERVDLKDDARRGRPSTARSDENVESVRRPLTEDSRTFLKMTGDHLNTGKEAARRIVNEDLGKRSCLDHRAETRKRCLLPGSSFNGKR